MTDAMSTHSMCHWHTLPCVQVANDNMFKMVFFYNNPILITHNSVTIHRLHPP